MELYPGYLEDHFKLSAPGRYMTSESTAQFAASPGPMGIYGRRHQPLAAGVWGEPFRPNGSAQAAAAAAMAMESPTEAKFDSRVQDVDVSVQEALRSSPDSFDQEGTKPKDKIQRRLAQNRQAARKSRLRKKAYIQNLETSRMKLAQLEQELNRARRKGVYIGGSSLSGPIDSGVAAFEMEYAHWVEEQGEQTGELRAALQAHASEIQLRILVEAGLAHYDRLFQAKSVAAKSDIFFVMSGMWRTPAERFFLWIGGFRPSELLKILGPQLEPLTEQQATAVNGLQQTARQAEDALSHGMEKLQQTLAESLTTTLVVAQGSDSSPDAAAAGSCYRAQMTSAMGSLDGLVGFVDQADHLRQQTLQNTYKILTARQAARGLLALGDYCQRLRALSSLWAARPREPA